MQIDAEFAAAIGTISSVISAAVGYGIVKGKVERLEKEIDAYKVECKSELDKLEGRYVTLPHFDAVVEPIRATLESVQRDIKEILRAVSTSAYSKI